MEEENYDLIFSLEQENWWYQAKRDLIFGLLKKINKNYEKVLDLGCGVGSNFGMLKKYSKSVVGIDYFDKALDYCKGKGYDEIKQMSAENLTFKDNSFDLVLCSDVLEHIEHDDKALSEIKRVLKPGGMFIFSVPAHMFLWGPVDEVSLHYRRYQMKKIKPLLRNYFDIKKLSYWNLSMFIPNVAYIHLNKVLNTKKKAENTLGKIPKFMNSLLYGILKIENKIFTKYRMFDGVSIVGIAKKP
tara:strand:- start:1324 stop:2052 length:729 start_codon:yes stop_codon:yes gene_type:complete